MRTLIFLLAGLVASCATGERMAWLEEGMTPAQVTDTIGSPTGQQRVGEVLVYSYSDRMISAWHGWNRTDFYTAFENDKLVAWGQNGPVRQYQPNMHMVMPVPFPGQQLYQQPAPSVVIQQQPGYLPAYTMGQ